jgi:hypothetical protein
MRVPPTACSMRPARHAPGSACPLVSAPWEMPPRRRPRISYPPWRARKIWAAGTEGRVRTRPGRAPRARAAAGGPRPHALTRMLGMGCGCGFFSVTSRRRPPLLHTAVPTLCFEPQRRTHPPSEGAPIQIVFAASNPPAGRLPCTHALRRQQELLAAPSQASSYRLAAPSSAPPRAPPLSIPSAVSWVRPSCASLPVATTC